LRKVDFRGGVGAERLTEADTLEITVDPGKISKEKRQSTETNRGIFGLVCHLIVTYRMLNLRRRNETRDPTPADGSLPTRGKDRYSSMAAKGIAKAMVAQNGE
jgi:hypothetical protein